MASKEMPDNCYDIDFLHNIAQHVAKGDSFDETLARAIEFAVWLVGCNECVTYVCEAEHLVPWVWKYSGDRLVEGSRLPIGHGCLRVLSEHLRPIAVMEGVGPTPEASEFSAWATDPGETSIWIPFVARSRLLGAMHLEHRHPHPYTRREIDLLASVGRILGADIRISELQSKNSDLWLRLESRKLIERGKGILQRDLGLSEEEAYLALLRQSRQKRRPMKEVAQAIILRDEVRRSSPQAE